MIVYEVNLRIHNSVKTEFLSWIENNVSRVLTASEFTKALLYTDESDEKKDTNFSRLTLHFTTTSEEVINNYRDNVAPGLRKEAEEKFGDNLRMTRRILRSIEKDSLVR